MFGTATKTPVKVNDSEGNLKRTGYDGAKEMQVANNEFQFKITFYFVLVITTNLKALRDLRFSQR
jgi:hypothetical protein